MKNVCVIGAGIVGLATAYKIQQKYPGIQVNLIEKEADVAQHQTGHNSGVIHSGIYYPTGSLKEKNCKEGYRQLINFCDENNISYQLCGKIIVATEPEELPILKNIYENGLRNGLENLSLLNPEQIKEYEPYVNGLQAIHVPQTGIIDYMKVSLKLKELIENNGGVFFFKEKVDKIIHNNYGAEIITSEGFHKADLVINCAGLYSDKIAQTTQDISYKIVPFRGEYYQLKPEKEFLVKNLVYPVPNPDFPFLGVHFTRKLKGGVEAGPNAVLAFGRESYNKTQVNWNELFETITYSGFLKVAYKYWKMGAYEMYRSYNKEVFTKALQKMLPDISKNDLVAGGSGIRAQAIDKKGNLIDDFLILREQNIIHVGNAPSPAATASLAIADYMVSLV